MNAFELVRPRGSVTVTAVPRSAKAPGLRSHIVVGDSPIDTALPQGLIRARKWRIGAPPHVGWWLARQGMATAGWRWWDGRVWSVPSPRSNNAKEAAALAQFVADRSESIVWCADYPPDARVPRVDPATDKVSGGVAP
ncbi:MAG: hypothetical protein WA955_15685 [Diaphorobacter nitroreducens]|uniref:hypothetical protein n=1 Tax=Diaphorobacter nitroreducens TaxID=164759 RepID=UPI003C75574A